MNVLRLKCRQMGGNGLSFQPDAAAPLKYENHM